MVVLIIDPKEASPHSDRADSGLFGAVTSGDPMPNSKGAEEHIGEEVVEFDHDDGGEGKPDRRKNRSCGEELFHGLGSRGCGWNERLNRR
jgi:hypothetical protein